MIKKAFYNPYDNKKKKNKSNSKIFLKDFGVYHLRGSAFVMVLVTIVQTRIFPQAHHKRIKQNDIFQRINPKQQDI